MSKIILLFTLFFSVCVNASNLSDENYQKIENLFLNYAEDNGDKIQTFDVNNYLKLTESEKKQIENINTTTTEPAIKNLTGFMLNGEAHNRAFIINYIDNVTAWVMAKGLKGNNFKNNECSYLYFLSASEDCLDTALVIKQNVKEVLLAHGIKLNESYFSDFFYLHELSHLIPQQRKVPEDIDVTKIWVENTPLHYREIYSDLFAVMYLNNVLKYNEEDIYNVIAYRDFNLNGNSDLVHYSVPYIQALVKDPEWKNAKTFESMDRIIQKIYKQVNDEMIISKKEFKDVHRRNFEWCNELDFSKFRIREALHIVVHHCKKIKKDY